jgi:hypothetical protein
MTHKFKIGDKTLIGILLPNEPIQSVNEIDKMHWATRNNHKKWSELRVRAGFDPEKAKVTTEPVTVWVVAYFPNKRAFDANNLYTKGYIDALQEWFYPNDKPEYVVQVNQVSLIDPGASPRVEIYIEPWTAPQWLAGASRGLRGLSANA